MGRVRRTGSTEFESARFEWCTISVAPSASTASSLRTRIPPHTTADASTRSAESQVSPRGRCRALAGFKHDQGGGERAAALTTSLSGQCARSRRCCRSSASSTCSCWSGTWRCAVSVLVRGHSQGHGQLRLPWPGSSWPELLLCLVPTRAVSVCACQ